MKPKNRIRYKLPLIQTTVKFNIQAPGKHKQTLTATKFIRRITTVISKVTHSTAIDALFVCTLVLSVKVAGFETTSTQGHVVFVTAITTVVNAIAQLVARHTTMIFTLEPLECIAAEVH